MSKRIAKVALNSPLRSLFDYRMHEGQARVGQRVQVSFGKRKMVGMLVGITQESELSESQLKPLGKCIDDQASVSAELLEFILWAANYYQHPVGEALFHALPKRLREFNTLEHKDFLVWVTTEAGENTSLDFLKQAPKQREALELIRNHPAGLSSETCKTLKVSLATLRALEQKGLTEQIQKYSTGIESEKPKQLLRSPSLQLNQEQQAALSKIFEKPEVFNCFLLNGITGSGKTEVYLQAIEHIVNQGKQALVLIPEIGLTPQTLKRFQHRFSCDIVSIHSGLSDTQRYKAWYKAKNAEASIVIGTRSAIFSEIPNLGIIIVDEEHDLSYKQQEGFRYSARDLAVRRAQIWGIPVVLGSATPSLESIHNLNQNRYLGIELRKRANDAFLPTLQLQDIRNAELQGGLSHQSIQKIRTHIQAGHQALVFINRRGYSPALICPECNWLATCPYCDARFTYHKGKQLLLCHHCNFHQAPLQTCPQCQSGEMHALGQGTEKVEETLKQHFPKVPVLRIDKDSSQSKEALSRHFAFIQQGEPCIMVGTQMLSKGHHFPKVTLVCIIDADQGFFSSDFRAMERMGQTLLQISGRAGRESRNSEALIQTELPEHPGLQSLIKDGYMHFAMQMLEERAAIDYPPYGFLCLLRADAPQLETSMAFLESVKTLMQVFESNVRLMGPAPATMQKRAGRHRAQLLLHSSQRAHIQVALTQSIPKFTELPLVNKVRWSVDVDPLETF